MPVQSGTATPWREVEEPNPGDSVLYMRPGEVVGSADLLAEQMRADGVIYSLGPAIRLAGEAGLTVGWYGLNEDGGEELCDSDGWTSKGEAVDEPRRCVLARVDVSSV